MISSTLGGVSRPNKLSSVDVDAKLKRHIILGYESSERGSVVRVSCEDRGNSRCYFEIIGDTGYFHKPKIRGCTDRPSWLALGPLDPSHIDVVWVFR